VSNKSDKGGGENSFPLKGKSGTTYAGGDNPRNVKTKDWDYSQPIQNLADYAGYVHDKAYDDLHLDGFSGTMDPKSTKANLELISASIRVVKMYQEGATDPFTGMPVSKRTMEAAKNMITAFVFIEAYKAAKK